MIVVVDFGMGNIWSVSSALNFLDAPHLISSEPKVVQEADALILPGVGSFGKAMKTLDDKGLSETIIEVVTQKQRKILGICLGFQLMAEIGTEDGTTKGLGLFPGTVDHFRTDGINDKKIPTSVSMTLPYCHQDLYLVGCKKMSISILTIPIGLSRVIWTMPWLFVIME